MDERLYQRILVEAGIIMPSSYGPGLPVWRERGLRIAELLIDLFTAQLSEFCEPTKVEHPFLMPAGPYRQVFGHYDNTYAAELETLGGSVVLRPDNMVQNVDRLLRSGEQGPLVAMGGLLRVLKGNGLPLFRDRYIWPAVQVTHLVPRRNSLAVLGEHQRALQQMLTALNLPVISVRTDAVPGYGEVCLLSVSCLPDGRPTVLSTAYVMADRYRRALGSELAVLDVGFTGKVIALAALHHRDHRGVQLPSAIAPVQLGVLAGQRGADDGLHSWRDRLHSASIRTEVACGQGEPPYRRFRAERRFHRDGVPLVVGFGAGTTLARRAPLVRQRCANPPSPVELHAHLAAYDRRLKAKAQRSFDRGLREQPLLRVLCPACAQAEPVFGWTVPERVMACTRCGGAGAEALVSASGRFY